jgi:hypothetical protein
LSFDSSLYNGNNTKDITLKKKYNLRVFNIVYATKGMNNSPLHSSKVIQTCSDGKGVPADLVAINEKVSLQRNNMRF